MKKQQIIFKGSGRITTAAFIKNKNMRYGQIRFKGGGRIKNVRITGLSEEGGGEESGEYTDEECLGFTAVDGDVTVSLSSNDNNNPIIYYKREKEDWVLWDYRGINIAEGETVRFYGDNNFSFNKVGNAYSYFIMNGSGNIEASGECNSLLSKEKTKVITPFCFRYLFYKCNKLISAPKLSATVLAENCYEAMFMDCTSLKSTPVLSATSLAKQCYYEMFQGCTSLTVACDLPATILYEECYSYMFFNCGIVNTPVISATTLALKSCRCMFGSCRNLISASVPLATVLSDQCYSSMFEGCINLITVNTLPATTLANSCYSSMFKSCTALTKAPALTATVLKSGCYSSMFCDCTSLTVPPILSATTLAENCYSFMFKNCTSLITAPNLSATNLSNMCYYSMFIGCTSLVNAPNLPATTLKYRCYYSMFEGCTNLITAPKLSTSVLAQDCYGRMFYGCSKLNYVDAAFTTVPSTTYTNNWLYGVASEGTFVKNPNATWDVSGPNGVPEGWTVFTEKELKSITFTKGGYINTGVKFVPGDNIRFKFKIKNVSGGALLFGAGTPSDNGYSNRLTFNRNEASGSIAQIFSSGNNTTTLKFFSAYAILDNSETDINFSFAGQDKSFFTINGNSAVINEFNINNKPNTATQYSLYLNNYNFGGQIPSLNIDGADMTFYGFEMYDELGMTKCKLIPVLTSNGPKIKNTKTNSYIDISIVEGKTVDISYEEL